jgi:hypothetical protein
VPPATNAFWQKYEGFHSGFERLRKLGHAKRCAISVPRLCGGDGTGDNQIVRDSFSGRAT